ncbi:restriction endonuclease [Rhizobium leguminosarum]|uniref:restriction endonuclease n=1 Tax=Rhizobium leguminosarum TaxID=384 RepID=UPI003F9D9EFA
MGTLGSKGLWIEPTRYCRLLDDELLQRTLANSPAFFEQLIVDLLVAMGYGGSHKDAAARLGRSSDGGVDGIATRIASASTASMSRPSAMHPATLSDAQTSRASSEVSSASAPPRASSSPPPSSVSRLVTTSSIPSASSSSMAKNWPIS